MENNSEKIRHQIIANNEAMAEIERSSIKPRICFDFSKRNIFLASPQIAEIWRKWFACLIRPTNSSKRKIYIKNAKQWTSEWWNVQILKSYYGARFMQFYPLK